MNDVTQILAAIRSGTPGAADELLPLVYSELRRMAGQRLALEGSGHTLQPTVLVHDAWMRLAGDGAPHFACRAHFFAAAAESMRRILVESARRRLARKRTSPSGYAEYVEAELAGPVREEEMCAVDDALDALARRDPEAANLVKLRYFVGMTMEEASKAMGLSLRATERLWSYARASLRSRLDPAGSEATRLP